MPRTHTKKNKKLQVKLRYVAALIGVFLLVIAAGTFIFPSLDSLSGQITARSTESQSKPTIPNPFDGVSIMGNAAYVVDLTTGKVLYQKNAQEALPLASITKLMTALVTLDHSSQVGDATTEVTIDQQSLQQAGDGGDEGLLLGEKWDVKDLLEYSLISSSNVGSTALSRGIFAGEDASTSESDFIQAMNQKAAQLGFGSMSFYNDNGLDISSTQAGAYGSAQDVSKLMAYAVSTERDVIGTTALKSKKFESASGIGHNAINTDEIVGELPGLIASKTGYTDLAGGNLVVAFDAGLNHPVVITVLGSTEDGRFSDVLALASTTMEYLAEQPDSATSTITAPIK